MSNLLKQLFTWWNGQTIATRYNIWRMGERVGEDAEGNVYYTSKDGARRWVVFNGYADASRVPPEWHGWLHHTWQEPPTDRPVLRKEWEKPHMANMTGRAEAYRPPGSILSRGPQARPDYEAWSPE